MPAMASSHTPSMKPVTGPLLVHPTALSKSWHSATARAVAIANRVQIRAPDAGRGAPTWTNEPGRRSVNERTDRPTRRCGSAAVRAHAEEHVLPGGNDGPIVAAAAAGRGGLSRARGAGGLCHLGLRLGQRFL